VTRFRDLDGNPISLLVWAKAFELHRWYVQDVVGDYVISTVYIGIEDFMFETKVFDKEHNSLEEYTENYDTLKEAVRGHEYTQSRLHKKLYLIK